MSLYDYISCDYPLPDLGHNDSYDCFAGSTFQSKDTPSQYLDNYKITSNGQLIQFSSGLSTNSHFTGIVNFYDYLAHEYDNCNWIETYSSYEGGWIEFQANFADGKIIEDIKLINFKKPRKLSDEEILENQIKTESFRKEIEHRKIDARKNNPTPQEKLLDKIDLALNAKFPIMEIEDYTDKIFYISVLIAEYRKEHDKYYKA